MPPFKTKSPRGQSTSLSLPIKMVRELESILGYSFQQPALLCEAITHRSYWHGKPGVSQPNNERLEFLGDAVLSLIMSEFLVLTYPMLKEGELSKIKAYLVSRATLAHIARLLNLGRFLRLGRGEETSRGREKDSLLGNALEAVIAAIYLDGGLEAAREFVHRLFQETVQQPDILVNALTLSDYKSRLQEWSQKHCGDVPHYRIVQELGPDHQKAFHVEVTVTNEIRGIGTGKSKKEAEQMAAKHALLHAMECSRQPDQR